MGYQWVENGLGINGRTARFSGRAGFGKRGVTLIALGVLLCSRMGSCGACLAQSLADHYCRRAGVVFPEAQKSIQELMVGLDRENLLSNLVDLGLFELGRNCDSNIITLSNTVVPVGNVWRWPGGLALPNNTIGSIYVGSHFELGMGYQLLE
jgi:hypothetical protein